MIEQMADANQEPHDNEPYMGPRQLAWFKARLIAWREEILTTSGQTLQQLGTVTLNDPDIADRAANEADWTTQLRTRDRQRKLLSKIAMALQRIGDGEYGYCEATGDPITLKRLIARPVASMTVVAQEAHERDERVRKAA